MNHRKLLLIILLISQLLLTSCGSMKYREVPYYPEKKLVKAKESSYIQPVYDQWNNRLNYKLSNGQIFEPVSAAKFASEITTKDIENQMLWNDIFGYTGMTTMIISLGLLIAASNYSDKDGNVNPGRSGDQDKLYGLALLSYTIGLTGVIIHTNYGNRRIINLHNKQKADKSMSVEYRFTY